MRTRSGDVRVTRPSEVGDSDLVALALPRHDLNGGTAANPATVLAPVPRATDGNSRWRGGKVRWLARREQRAGLDGRTCSVLQSRHAAP